MQFYTLTNILFLYILVLSKQNFSSVFSIKLYQNVIKGKSKMKNFVINEDLKRAGPDSFLFHIYKLKWNYLRKNSRTL